MNKFYKIVVLISCCFSFWGTESSEMRESAILYYEKRGEEFLIEEAYSKFERLAKTGDVESMVLAFALLYEFPKELKGKANEAVNFLVDAARSGNRNAQFNLGLILTKGIFVDQDITVANQWLELAYLSGDLEAGTILGLNLAREYLNKRELGSKDEDLLMNAVKYLEASRASGDGKAMSTLALLYYVDLNNEEKAIEFLNLAISFGNENAKVFLSKIKNKDG